MIVCNSPDDLIKKIYDYVAINKVKVISGAKDLNRASFGFKTSDGQIFVARIFSVEFNTYDRNLYDKIKMLNLSLEEFINKQFLLFI